MYSGRSSVFVGSGFLLISCCPLSCVSVAYSLLVSNLISWCFVLHVFEHLVNCIILLSQFTSVLCLTNQSCPKNIFMPFKYITAISICSLCPLILTSSGANLETSLFLEPSILKTSNNISAGLVLICSFFTSCLLIPICVHPESTSAWSCNSLPFFILILACMFSSFFLLFHWLGITYWFWALVTLVLYIMLTQNCLQNPALYCFLYLCPPEHFYFSFLLQFLAICSYTLQLKHLGFLSLSKFSLAFYISIDIPHPLYIIPIPVW